MENCTVPGCHVFQQTRTIFELPQDIIRTNLLTTVLTRKNALPLGSHVFLSKHIIETNLLTKFHEDWTIHVAFRVLTRQMLSPNDGQRSITKAHHEHIVLR
ncbi:hypothetical protein DPMN_095836 [Dreissena polymorpha]|uniref:Uncharacterized protein n=1 Tax=Dreissena polymorpha TaxID=45954 RepID=A0A9D4L8M8_DREPO|nr:hypothetical protein DPMN_095836 [Dreissena polymorpha]